MPLVKPLFLFSFIVFLTLSFLTSYSPVLLFSCYLVLLLSCSSVLLFFSLFFSSPYLFLFPDHFVYLFASSLLLFFFSSLILFLFSFLLFFFSSASFLLFFSFFSWLVVHQNNKLPLELLLSVKMNWEGENVIRQYQLKFFYIYTFCTFPLREAKKKFFVFLMAVPLWGGG